MKTLFRILLILVVILPAILVHAEADMPNVQGQLDSYIAKIAPADGSAVAARITIGADTWAAGGGLVDIKESKAASPEGRFRIASMSKTFLAVAVMQLNEAGTLTLDDPITKWLPKDITGSIANADQATIRQLLTMTSGIPEYLNADFYDTVAEDTQHPWTPQEALHYAYELPPLFAAGDGFEYTNTNYVLLQLIVEAATKKPMYEVLRAGIIDPLKLTDTYVQAQEKGGATVHGYEDFDGDDLDDDVTDINDGLGLGDGALVSTTADLTGFYQGVFVNHKILSEKSAQEMIDAGLNENEYGIGLEVFEGDYGQLIGHTGAVLGFTGAVYYAADLDAIVVILYGNTGLDMEHVNGLLDIASNS